MIVRQTAADAGRDPAAIEISAGSDGLARDPRGSVEELESLGVDRMVIPAFLFFRADDVAAAMSEFTASLR